MAAGAGTVATMEAGLATGAAAGGGWIGLAGVAASGAGLVPPAASKARGGAGSVTLVSSVWPVVAAGFLASGGPVGLCDYVLGWIYVVVRMNDLRLRPPVGR